MKSAIHETPFNIRYWVFNVVTRLLLRSRGEGSQQSEGNELSDQVRLSPTKSGLPPPSDSRFHFLNLFLFLITLVFAFTCKADHAPRKWTNSVGVTMEATLVSVQGSTATLLLGNNRIITVEISKLSKADQDYLDNWEKEEASGTPVPTTAATPQPAATAQPAPSAVEAATPAPRAENFQPRRSQANLLLKPGVFRKGAAPDPSIKPKEELYLTFPELGMSRSNEPMAMRVRIPENYSPDRPVPLIVWLAGGDGTSWYHEASELVDSRDFVMVGMNYPLSVPAPRFAAPQGQIGRIWELQEKMLAKLAQMIPNLDPRLRIVVGFSNGAHTIGGCLGEREQSFYGFFNVFVLIEGGDSVSFNYPSLPGRYFYLAWGTAKEGDGSDFGNRIANAARKAQMNVEAHGMEGVGHDFPATEERKVNTWLRTVVIPNLDPNI